MKNLVYCLFLIAPVQLYGSFIEPKTLLTSTGMDKVKEQIYSGYLNAVHELSLEALEQLRELQISCEEVETQLKDFGTHAQALELAAKSAAGIFLKLNTLISEVKELRQQELNHRCEKFRQRVKNLFKLILNEVCKGLGEVDTKIAASDLSKDEIKALRETSWILHDAYMHISTLGSSYLQITSMEETDEDLVAILRRTRCQYRDTANKFAE